MKKKTMRKLVSLLLLLAMLAGDFLMPAARSAFASDGDIATAALTEKWRRLRCRPN